MDDLYHARSLPSAILCSQTPVLRLCTLEPRTFYPGPPFGGVFDRGLLRGSCHQLPDRGPEPRVRGAQDSGVGRWSRVRARHSVSLRRRTSGKFHLFSVLITDRKPVQGEKSPWRLPILITETASPDRLSTSNLSR